MNNNTMAIDSLGRVSAALALSMVLDSGCATPPEAQGVQEATEANEKMLSIDEATKELEGKLEMPCRAISETRFQCINTIFDTDCTVSNGPEGFLYGCEFTVLQEENAIEVRKAAARDPRTKDLCTGGTVRIVPDAKNGIELSPGGKRARIISC